MLRPVREKCAFGDNAERLGSCSVRSYDISGLDIRRQMNREEGVSHPMAINRLSCAITRLTFSGRGGLGAIYFTDAARRYRLSTLRSPCFLHGPELGFYFDQPRALFRLDACSSTMSDTEQAPSIVRSHHGARGRTTTQRSTTSL